MVKIFSISFLQRTSADLHVGKYLKHFQTTYTHIFHQMSDKKSKNLPKEKFVTIYETFFKVKQKQIYLNNPNKIFIY